jgi:uncharacterized membrane protein YebE (DUF533 family)
MSEEYKLHKPKKLARSPELLGEKVAKYVRSCVRVEKAAGLAGIADSTYRNWKRWMKEEQEHGYTGTQIQRFFEPILKAEAEAEMDLVTVVTDKAKVEGDWKAAAFLLEKRFKYNNRQELELSTNDEESNKININITKMSEKHGKPECGDDGHSDGVD